MSLRHIPIDRITEADLQQLLVQAVRESTHLDYKRQTYQSTDKAKEEYLADVSSFANTLGGDIVIGIAEEKGIPTEFTPIGGNIDAEILRLEQLAQSGIEPRISQLQFRAVPISSGGHILVIRAPRSLYPPHRVVARENNRFWARAGSGKYQPNVQQLRQLFNEAPHLAERIRMFHADRLTKIAAGDTPVALNQSGKIVVQVIPAPAFADDRMTDVVQIMADGTHIPLPLGQMSASNQGGVNLDGYFCYSDRLGGSRRAYAQFFRNGAIETVGELPHSPDGQPHFAGPELTSLVIGAVRQYLGVSNSYDTGLPIHLFLSFCNATDTVYQHAQAGVGWHTSNPIGREVVSLPAVYIQSYDVDVGALLRPTFNILWNTVGIPQCDMYDNRGHWRGNTT